MKESNISKVVENLMAIYPLLHRAIVKPLRSNCTLSPGIVFILGVLKNNGTLSMSDIGKKLGIPKPNVTTLVDKMIAENYAERLHDENDRRIVNIRITEKGLETFLFIQKEASEELQNKLMVLDEEEIIKLEISTLKIKEILRSVHKTD